MVLAPFAASASSVLTGTEWAKHDRPMRLIAFVCVLAAVSASAQTPGAAAFRVYEKGALVGSVNTSVERTPEGWRIRGSSRIAGSIPVVIPNLDLYYDAAWAGRFMTIEMKAPDDAIVHVAVVGGTTRTDIVRSTEARFQSSSVSPDTIFVPDRAFGAYEAVAARLARSAQGLDLPIFIPPLGETRASVDRVSSDQFRTARGPITARHYSMTELRQRPTPVEIWVASGRLIRLDLPRASISIVRSDILPQQP
jgi:hypothetical protein